jgi:hypothetical protein
LCPQPEPKILSYSKEFPFSKKLQFKILSLAPISVHCDPEQLGEVHQAAAADHDSDVPVAERGRDDEEDQDQDRVPVHAAHLQAVARREDFPVGRREVMCAARTQQ